MNKSLKYGLFLLALGVIVGGLLAVVNAITAPIIKENELNALRPQIQEVSPDTEEFEDVTSDYEKTNGIEKIFFDEDNNIYIYWVYESGYKGGKVSTLVAFDADTKKIVDAKVTGAVEQTPGIGDRVLTQNFNAKGKDASVYANLQVATLDKKDFGTYAVITGATVSSKAVLSGISIASKHFLSVVGE